MHVLALDLSNYKLCHPAVDDNDDDEMIIITIMIIFLMIIMMMLTMIVLPMAGPSDRDMI